MNFSVHITVHVYAEDKLVDNLYLDPKSENYGIIGEEIIAPLKRINGENFSICDVSETYTVGNLWDWLEDMLYADINSPNFDNVLNFVQEYCILDKYLCFNGIRYSALEKGKPIIDYLRRMGASNDDPKNIQVLVCGDAGEVWQDDGIRYYMPSKEESPHNTPHVHVDIRHEESGTFSLLTGEQMQKKEKVKPKYARKIRLTIMENQKKWLEYWNEYTDGLDVDLNQAFGLIKY